MSIPQNYLRAYNRKPEGIRRHLRCDLCQGSFWSEDPTALYCPKCVPGLDKAAEMARAGAQKALEPRAEPETAQTASTLCGVKFGPMVIGEKRKAPGLSKPRGRKGMNKCESAFALRLDIEKKNLQIARYDREGITLRWPDGMTYTPDFVVWEWHTPSENPFMAGDGPVHPTMVEVKGAWIEDDAKVKFRAARAYWPEFGFEMWQCKKGQWEKIL